MTYSECWEELLRCLQEAAGAIGVPAEQIVPGRYREQPMATPFVWVYLEPGSWITGMQAGGSAECTATIFIGLPPMASSREANEAGHRAAVAAGIAITNSTLRARMPENPISLDEVTQMHTAFRIECLIPYDL